MKMDIIIKSFNRPYYLDRCIYSIYKFVEGSFTITIVDDGTPDKYLQKIKQKYSDVIIKKSENAINKEKEIENNLENGSEINGFEIPTQLWIDTVKEASNYFIITEDDVWFTSEVNITSLERTMKQENIYLTKLGWLGNPLFKSFNCKQLNSDLISIQPELFTAPFFIMDLFFYNKYKFFSLLYKLKLVDNTTSKKYWILNSILMGMYNKEYWLEIWKNARGKVNEKQQLLNASVFYHKHKSNPNFLAQLDKEVMKTTFISSSSNSYHKYGYDFDVNLFNHIINEKWYNDEFDSLENFPKDFSGKYISHFLENADKTKASPKKWEIWAEQFKAQYRNTGCEVENT